MRLHHIHIKLNDLQFTILGEHPIGEEGNSSKMIIIGRHLVSLLLFATFIVASNIVKLVVEEGQSLPARFHIDGQNFYLILPRTGQRAPNNPVRFDLDELYT